MELDGRQYQINQMGGYYRNGHRYPVEVRQRVVDTLTVLWKGRWAPGTFTRLARQFFVSREYVGKLANKVESAFNAPTIPTLIGVFVCCITHLKACFAQRRLSRPESRKEGCLQILRS
jgi:hypothetical protein